MIGIICAMELEASRLKGALQHARKEVISGVEYMSGLLCAQEVVVAVSGVGKVFAAICAQTMILQYKPRLLINTGIAGALDETLRMGEIVIADQVMQHDMDTSAVGDPPGMISGINQVFLPCSERIVEAMAQSIGAVEGLAARVGTIASGDQFVADPAKKAAIRAQYGAIACEMEGAAIGQVCYINKLGFAVLRAISDGVGGGMDYAAFSKMAAENSCLVLEQFLVSFRI